MGKMNNQLGRDKDRFGACGLPEKPQVPKASLLDYVPSKTDLFKLLDGLRFRDPPKTRIARVAFFKATRARKVFERSNETWIRLSRAEKLAERRLNKIAGSEREHEEREVGECRRMLRLYGVTPSIIQRIEQLTFGKESEE